MAWGPPRRRGQEQPRRRPSPQALPRTPVGAEYSISLQIHDDRIDAPARLAMRIRPAAGDEPEMPAQQSLRPDEERVPAASRHHPTQRRQQQPVVRLVPRLTRPSTKDRELVTEHLKVFRSITAAAERNQLEQATDYDAQRGNKQRRPPTDATPTLPPPDQNPVTHPIEFLHPTRAGERGSAGKRALRNQSGWAEPGQHRSHAHRQCRAEQNLAPRLHQPVAREFARAAREPRAGSLVAVPAHAGRRLCQSALRTASTIPPRKTSVPIANTCGGMPIFTAP